MNIYGKVDIGLQQKKFKDLKTGDVFCFVKDLCKCHPEIKIYMRCGRVEADKTAMNLETGIMYTFDEYEPVKILSAVLNVKGEAND